MHAGGDFTSATQLPVTETSPPTGTCWTEENLDPDLQYHIQHCTCSCNHMGYGNFSDYQVRISNFSYNILITEFPRESHQTVTDLCSGKTVAS
ncbi:hypothetical protein WDU94_003151 [Cyamophila willieti]